MAAEPQHAPFDESAACADLAAADVSVSSDNLGIVTEALEGTRYSRHGQLNTGVVVWRRTEAALALGGQMVRGMGGEVDEIHGVVVKGLKTDQQLFNQLADRGRMAEHCLKRPLGAAARERAAWREQHTDAASKGDSTLMLMTAPLARTTCRYWIESCLTPNSKS